MALYQLQPDWWFGTWLDYFYLWLSIQLGMSWSQLLRSPWFFRGVGWNHQPATGSFYGIIHSINGVSSVLITGISGRTSREQQPKLLDGQLAETSPWHWHWWHWSWCSFWRNPTKRDQNRFRYVLGRICQESLWQWLSIKSAETIETITLMAQVVMWFLQMVVCGYPLVNKPGDAPVFVNAKRYREKRHLRGRQGIQPTTVFLFFRGVVLPTRLPPVRR